MGYFEGVGIGKYQYYMGLLPQNNPFPIKLKQNIGSQQKKIHITGFNVYLLIEECNYKRVEI
jgi:hypothetical protein